MINQVPPTKVIVTVDSDGPVAESMARVFTCELVAPGSNPPSQLVWHQLDSMGALLPLVDVHTEPTEQIGDAFGAYRARSRLKVIARRAVNGRRFECSAMYQQQNTLLRSEQIMEVKCTLNFSLHIYVRSSEDSFVHGYFCSIILKLYKHSSYSPFSWS